MTTRTSDASTDDKRVIIQYKPVTSLAGNNNAFACYEQSCGFDQISHALSNIHGLCGCSCNLFDVISVYSFNPDKLPGHFSYKRPGYEASPTLVSWTVQLKENTVYQVESISVDTSEVIHMISFPRHSHLPNVLHLHCFTSELLYLHCMFLFETGELGLGTRLSEMCLIMGRAWVSPTLVCWIKNCHIPYSGKFSRGQIFAVFAVDW